MSTLAKADSTSSKAPSHFRPDIQGLRAVAVLMVVAFHSGLPVSGGFVDVDVFFVISGFVMTAMLQREFQHSGRIRFRHFYYRRFKRLTPALAVMVSSVVWVPFVLLSPVGGQSEVGRTALGAMFLSANFVIARYSGGYFGPDAERNPLLNIWSLSVAKQFYLFFPARIAVGWMLARRQGLLRYSPVIIVSSVSIVSFTIAMIGFVGLTFQGSDLVLGFYSPDTRAWEFAVGALLALLVRPRTVRSPSLASTSSLVGAALLLLSM